MLQGCSLPAAGAHETFLPLSNDPLRLGVRAKAATRDEVAPAPRAQTGNVLARADLLLADTINPQMTYRDSSSLMQPYASSAWLQPWPAGGSLRVRGFSSSTVLSASNSRPVKRGRRMATVAAATASTAAEGHAAGTSYSQAEARGGAGMLRPLHGQLLQHLISSVSSVQHIKDIVLHHREALQPEHIKALLLQLRKLMQAEQAMISDAVAYGSTSSIDGGSSADNGLLPMQLQMETAQEVPRSSAPLLLLQQELRHLLYRSGTAVVDSPVQFSSSLRAAERGSAAVQSRAVTQPAPLQPQQLVSATVAQGLDVAVDDQVGSLLQGQRRKALRIREAEERQQCYEAVTGLHSMAKSARRPVGWQLAALVRTCELRMDIMNPVQLSSLAWSLAKLNHLPDEAWMAGFYRRTQRIADLTGPRELCTILWALATLCPSRDTVNSSIESALEPATSAEAASAAFSAHALPPAWLRTWLDCCTARIGAFNPRDLSQTFWALAKLRARPDTAWAKAALAHVLPHARPPQIRGLKGSAYSARDLANLLWALATLRINPGVRWTEKVLAALEARGGLDCGSRNTATPHDAAQLLWSLGSLRQQQQPRVVHALLMRVCVAPLGALVPQDLATSCWALAVLDFQPPPDLRRRLLKHAVFMLQRASVPPQQQQSQQEQQGSHSDIGAAMLNSSSGDMSSSSSSTVNSSIRGHVVAGIRSNARTGGAIFGGDQSSNRQVEHARGGGAPAHGDSLDVIAHGSFSATPDPGPGPANQDFGAFRHQLAMPSSTEQKHDMSAALPILLWSLNKLNWTSGCTPLLIPAARLATFQSQALTPQGVVVLLYCFARAMYKPHPVAVYRLLKRLGVDSDSVVSSRVATPQALAMLLWALGTLQFRAPQPWIRRLLVHTVHLLPNARLSELHSMARGLALLRHWPDALWLGVFAGCLRRRMTEAAEDPHALTPAQQRWLTWALPRIQVHGSTLKAARRMLRKQAKEELRDDAGAVKISDETEGFSRPPLGRMRD